MPELRILAAVLAAAVPLVVSAQPPDSEATDHGPEEHMPIDVDRGLEWGDVLERAVTNYPRFLELDAREREASALQRRGRSLIAGRPSLLLGYRSDDPLDDYNLAEYEAALTLPLWRFGERRAARRIGDSASDEAAAAEAALIWEVAGALRESLWDIEAAVNRVELAVDALAVAEDIERIVSRRHALGDLPLEDALLAEATVLERRSNLIEMRAELVDAEFTYELLTTLRIRPPAFAEALTARRDFAASHPLLSLAEAEVERARADLALAERTAKGSPTLAVGPRRQRDPLTDYYTDSVGVELSVPVGGGSHSAASAAPAYRRLAAAESARAALERQLHAALHEALHTLETTDGALGLARQRAEIAARHRGMGQTAFEQGELALTDLLRRDETARLAARQARGLEVQRGRAIAAVNQAVGELP